MSDDTQRYERGLRGIAAAAVDPLLSVDSDFREWVAEQIENLLGGGEADCWMCGTAVHAGPCAGESDEGSSD